MSYWEPVWDSEMTGIWCDVYSGIKYQYHCVCLHLLLYRYPISRILYFFTLSYDPEIPLLSVYTKILKIHGHTKTWTRMFIAAFIIINKKIRN